MDVVGDGETAVFCGAGVHKALCDVILGDLDLGGCELVVIYRVG